MVKQLEEILEIILDLLSDLNFRTCLVGLDTWISPGAKSDDSKCYDYALLHADDSLVVSENAESILRKILASDLHSMKILLYYLRCFLVDVFGK